MVSNSAPGKWKGIGLFNGVEVITDAAEDTKTANHGQQIGTRRTEFVGGNTRVKNLQAVAN